MFFKKPDKFFEFLSTYEQGNSIDLNGYGVRLKDYESQYSGYWLSDDELGELVAIKLYHETIHKQIATQVVGILLEQFKSEDDIKALFEEYCGGSDLLELWYEIETIYSKKPKDDLVSRLVQQLKTRLFTEQNSLIEKYDLLNQQGMCNFYKYKNRRNDDIRGFENIVSNDHFRLTSEIFIKLMQNK